MSKKILIFSLAYYPRFTSGAEAAIKEITDRTNPSDIEFHMLTVRFSMEDLSYEKIGNVHIHRVGFGYLYFSKILFIPFSAFIAFKLNKKYKFDAIWAMMTYMLFPVVLMRFLGSRVPYILTLQDGDPYDKVFKRWFIRPVTPLLNYGFRNASIIQVISKYLATWPVKRGYKGNIVLVHNGANPKDIEVGYNEKEVEVLKEKLGKGPNDIFLVNTARLVHQKGFDTTIRALPMLPDNIRLLIVGDGEDRKKLEKLVKRLNVQNRVIFVGKVKRSEVTQYRRVSDIFVGPSRSEGLGNAFLSAMASELPVIATQEGGITEFLFDKKHNPDKEITGWVVDKDKPEQISEAVKDIISNPDKVEGITKTARAMVLEKFNWDIVARNMQEKVFNKVIW